MKLGAASVFIASVRRGLAKPPSGDARRTLPHSYSAAPRGWPGCPGEDAILALTSPPLISFLGALAGEIPWLPFLLLGDGFQPGPGHRRLAGCGRLRSWPGCLSWRMSRFSLRRAARIVALDRFMRDRIVAKGIAPEKVTVLAPWPQDGEIHFDRDAREGFRQRHGLAGKFARDATWATTVPAIRWTPSLEAAAQLRHDPAIVFWLCRRWQRISPRFSDWRKRLLRRNFRVEVRPSVRDRSRVETFLCLLPTNPWPGFPPCCPRRTLQVVVMGDPFVGLVHPCKIYNILSVGAPVLYIGPKPSPLVRTAGCPAGLSLLPPSHTARRAGCGRRLNASASDPTRARRPVPPAPSSRQYLRKRVGLLRVNRRARIHLI